MTPKDPAWNLNGSFEPTKFFRVKFSPEVWAEVGRKFIVLSSQSKMYESGQHPHATSFRNFLVIHSEKGSAYF